MRVDPRHRIGTRLDACADIELQYEVRRRFTRDQLHYPLASRQLRPLGIVIVHARQQAMRAQCLRRGGEFRGQLLPLVHRSRLHSRRRENHVACTEDLIDLDALRLRVTGYHRGDTVVRRVTVQRVVVQHRAHRLGVRQRPAKVRRVELHHLIAQLLHGAQCVRQILLQLTAHGIELDADGIDFRSH